MMEVENPRGSASAGFAHVMKAAPHSKTGRQILLHPLAIVTICDHCTRVKVGGSKQSAESRILGLLFGFQDGLQASITDAIELQYEVVNGEIKISPDYVNEKKELYTAVYPNSEIMGWYAVGSEVEANALDLHRTMNTWNESPILLLLNPSAEAAKDLPVSLFESELHVVDDKPTLLFVSVPFQLETAQAERISVEHVVKATPTEGVSSVDLHVEAVSTSLKALYMRIQSLLRFLQFTKDGTLPPDYAILRQVGNLCNQLPAAESPAFQSAFLNEYSDSMVVTYLASVTKLTTLANEVAEKFAMTYGDKNRRRGL